MKVVAYDPSHRRTRHAAGVEKVELDDLLARADIITPYTPLTDQTKNILSKENIAKTKKGDLINCARGGLADEAAVRAGPDSGQIAQQRSTCSAKSQPRPTSSGAPNSSPHRTLARPPSRHRQCRLPGRRTDGGLSATGCRHQRPQHAERDG
jgi:hypothetical protein